MSTPFRICFFCGSRPGARSAYVEAARAAGRFMAGQGHGVVYGGGSVGLMGELANACLDGGGEVIGVLPIDLFKSEMAHTGLTALHSVETMHERKAMMTRLADAFVVLPGGFGTLDEMFEAITWRQIGIHGKPLVVANVDGFFDGLLSFVGRLSVDGFIPSDAASTILVEPTAEAAITAALAAARAR